MVLITRIDCNCRLNRKAKALDPFIRMYSSCLMRYNDFVLLAESARKLVDDLNKEFPRTKPFVVSSFVDDDYPLISFKVEGHGDEPIATIMARKVRQALVDGDSIVPLDKVIIEIKEKE